MAHKIKLASKQGYDIEIGGITGTITPSDVDLRLRSRLQDIEKGLKANNEPFEIIEEAVDVFSKIYNKGFVDEVIAKYGLTESVINALTQGVVYAFTEFKKAKGN